LKALLTDIDGTITNNARRIDTGAIELIRLLADQGIEVVLASGNTSCFMESVSKMIGTQGSFIAENGGVFRAGYQGKPRLQGSQEECHRALETLQVYYRKKGKELELYSPTYRFVDLAFARTVPVEEVRSVLSDHPVQVMDTGYAIHLQSPGINKGTALTALARELGLSPKDFLAVGDSLNDIEMLKVAGIGAAVANAHPDAKAVAAYTAEKEYGNGFVEAVKKYYPYFRAR
jgi:phosphoglycolate phosphatase (TIGR01487 family)